MPEQCLAYEFQSTLPVRGATHLRAGAAHVRAISIHAPREGSDSRRELCPVYPSRFQSTLPVRGATLLDNHQLRHKIISIHAPRKGSDWAVNTDLWDAWISIHAPRKGSDAGSKREMLISGLFQSPLPVRGATSAVCASWLAVIFQSTLPVRGATRARAPHPHIPRVISIHAPRKGSDIPIHQKDDQMVC